MNIKQTIKAIESSKNMTEAARKLKITRAPLYKRLERHGLKVVRDTTLKVVER